MPLDQVEHDFRLVLGCHDRRRPEEERHDQAVVMTQMCDIGATLRITSWS